MKKISIITLVLFVMSILFNTIPVLAQDFGSLESLGNYGDLEYIYDNMEVSYDYNGERVCLNKNHMTLKELEVMLTVLSDEKLSFKDIKTTDAVETDSELFPKKGYVEFLDENDGNWVIAFDEKEVFVRCISPLDKTSRHGFFKYREDTMYNAFRAFFDNIVKRGTNKTEDTPDVNPEEKPAEPETEKYENQINIYDMEQIYSASFPLGNFSEGFSWGVCSYRRENSSSPVTLCYITFEGMEFLRVITEADVKDNRIVFENRRVAYFENGNDGTEYDINFGLTNTFELQVNVNDNGQVDYAVMTYRNVYADSPEETEVINMSEYKQSGYLPQSGKISFKKSNNIRTNEEKEESKENIEKLNWFCSVDDVVYEPKGAGVLKIDNSVMVSMTELCDILGYSVKEKNNKVFVSEDDNCRNSESTIEQAEFEIGDSKITVTEKSGAVRIIEDSGKLPLTAKYNGEIYISAYYLANILDLKLKNDSFEKEEIILYTRNYLLSKENNVVTFGKLTKLSDKNIKTVSIRKQGEEVTISSPEYISNIIDSIKDLQLRRYEDSGAGGWLYWVKFITDTGEIIEYTVSTGVKNNGVQYRAIDDSKIKECLYYYYNLYSSINGSTWAKDVIAYGIENNFVDNKSQDYTAEISREAFCDILVNAMEANDVKLSSKTSESAKRIADTANDNVKKLYLSEIIYGKGLNTDGEVIFAPQDFITREEAAVILYRTAKQLKIKFSENSPVSFSDSKDISPWAKEAVERMYEAGVMEGVSREEFRPMGMYTVEQTIATIVRLFNVYKEE